MVTSHQHGVWQIHMTNVGPLPPHFGPLSPTLPSSYFLLSSMSWNYTFPSNQLIQFYVLSNSRHDSWIAQWRMAYHSGSDCAHPPSQKYLINFKHRFTEVQSQWLWHGFKCLLHQIQSIPNLRKSNGMIAPNNVMQNCLWNFEGCFLKSIVAN